MFYNLDTDFKKWSVYGNCFATLVYSACLVYWLYRVEYNDKTAHGAQEDINMLHFVISIFVFYAIFLIERVGSFVLDTFQE